MNFAIAEIPGLQYIPNYLTADEQDNLMTLINQQTWLTDLKRRVQHYGYRYDYKTRKVHENFYLGPLPEWLNPLAERLYADGHIADVPDQAIINEYEPGQGIARHVDCIPCFGDTIISLSLGSACMMVYTEIATRREVPILLMPGSLVVMEGESRYEWMHAIPSRKSDVLNGQVIKRGRRISVTFRKVLL
jgi:alkylated DNA repair dioxygenase AlkB